MPVMGICSLIALFLSVASAKQNGVDYACLHNSSWLLNKDRDFNKAFQSLTEILDSHPSSTSKLWNISFPGIVTYDRMISSKDVMYLNGREQASWDFEKGKTCAKVGKIYHWGDDLCFNGCHGYWPPGPDCPTNLSRTAQFTLQPSPEIFVTGCYSRLGPIGRMINGAGVYDWSDGSDYDGTRTWRNVAPVFESHDIDICNGHSSFGEYHHHFVAPCLADKIGDHGQAHSPIYGFIDDGYPLYGPYQGPDLLAIPCWQKRKYSPSSPVGCPDGKRSCILVDEYDISKGTVSVSNVGPPEASTVKSMSGNTVVTTSGIYYEDYFYNASCFAQGKEYLNEFNGHEHDNLGFHYHLTMDQHDLPLFPYNVGPRFYGCRSGKSCCPRVGECKFTSQCGLSAALLPEKSSCITTKALPISPPSRHSSLHPSQRPTMYPATTMSVIYLSYYMSQSLISSLPLRAFLSEKSILSHIQSAYEILFHDFDVVKVGIRSILDHSYVEPSFRTLESVKHSSSQSSLQREDEHQSHAETTVKENDSKSQSASKNNNIIRILFNVQLEVKYSNEMFATTDSVVSSYNQKVEEALSNSNVLVVFGLFDTSVGLSSISSASDVEIISVSISKTIDSVVEEASSSLGTTLTTWQNILIIGLLLSVILWFSWKLSDYNRTSSASLFSSLSIQKLGDNVESGASQAPYWNGIQFSSQGQQRDPELQRLLDVN